MSEFPETPDAAAPAPIAGAGRSADSPGFQKWAAAGLLVFFALLSMAYLRSDLWFDELLTLIDYAGRPAWQDVFRHYPIANNHMLFSFVLWTWVRLVDFAISEEVLRFPCLIFSLLAIAAAHQQGRRFYGDGGGFLLALLLAFSPLYLSFFYQLRGYSLSICLATFATIGCLHAISGRKAEGAAWYVPAAALLPGVVPSNMLLNLSLFTFLNLVFIHRREWWRQLPYLFFLGCFTGLGVVFYVPIWSQFRKVMASTGGWASGWQVAGHWGLALLAHLGLFWLALLALRRQHGSEPDAQDRAPAQRYLGLLLLCCLLPMLVVALWRAPFPRAFLAYLAPLTFAGMLPFRRRFVDVDKTFYLLVFFVLANGLVALRCSEYLRQRTLGDGEFRQHLLVQFYNRNQDIQTAARAMALSQIISPSTRIFVDFHFYISFTHYWTRFGGNPRQVECLSGSGRFKPSLPPAAYLRLPQLIVAYSEKQARRAYQETLGSEVILEEVYLPTQLRLFRVTPVRQRQRTLRDGPPRAEGTDI